MEIKINQTVSREVFEDIFVTAIEGGSNYWYFLGDDATEAIRKAVPKSEEPYLSVAITKAIFDHGVVVPVRDVEDETLIIGNIDIKTIPERMQKLSDSEHSWALDAHLAGEGDADSADIIFQYLTMGEVVYG